MVKKENNSFSVLHNVQTKFWNIYLSIIWPPSCNLLSRPLFRPEIHWIIQLFSVKNCWRVLLTNTNYCWLVSSIWYLLNEQEVMSDALSFLPKINIPKGNYWILSFGLMARRQKVPKLDYQSHFSKSKIIWIFRLFLSYNTNLGEHFLLLTFFDKNHFEITLSLKIKAYFWQLAINPKIKIQ